MGQELYKRMIATFVKYNTCAMVEWKNFLVLKDLQ